MESDEGPSRGDEPTNRTLRKFDDLIQGLPALADSVAGLNLEVPQLRAELQKFGDVRQGITDIKQLMREAMDAGVQAASGYEEMKFEHEQQGARLHALERRHQSLLEQLSKLPCMTGVTCDGNTIPSPPSGMG